MPCIYILTGVSSTSISCVLQSRVTIVHRERMPDAPTMDVPSQERRGDTRRAVLAAVVTDAVHRCQPIATHIPKPACNPAQRLLGTSPLTCPYERRRHIRNSGLPGAIPFEIAFQSLILMAFFSCLIVCVISSKRLSFCEITFLGPRRSSRWGWAREAPLVGFSSSEEEEEEAEEEEELSSSLSLSSSARAKNCCQTRHSKGKTCQ